MDNVIGTAPLTDGPGLETFTSRYQAEFETQPGPFNPQTFDAAAVLLLATAAAEEETGPAISDAMPTVANDGSMSVTPDNLADGVDAAGNSEDIVYEGASSTISFDETGDLQTGAYEVWEYAPDSESGVDRVDEFVLE